MPSAKALSRKRLQPHHICMSENSSIPTQNTRRSSWGADGRHAEKKESISQNCPGDCRFAPTNSDLQETPRPNGAPRGTSPWLAPSHPPLDTRSLDSCRHLSTPDVHPQPSGISPRHRRNRTLQVPGLAPPRLSPSRMTKTRAETLQLKNLLSGGLLITGMIAFCRKRKESYY